MKYTQDKSGLSCIGLYINNNCSVFINVVTIKEDFSGPFDHLSIRKARICYRGFFCRESNASWKDLFYSCSKWIYFEQGRKECFLLILRNPFPFDIGYVTWRLSGEGFLLRLGTICLASLFVWFFFLLYFIIYFFNSFPFYLI